MRPQRINGPTRGPADDHGFTLVEILVALVLTALLSAALATAVQTARRILAASERNAEVGDVIAAQAFLRASFASAFITPVTPGHLDDLEFRGTETRVTLATSHIPKGLHQGLYRIEFDLTPAASGNGRFDLMAHARPARRTLPGTEPVAPRTYSSKIIGNIAAAKFTYFGKPGRDATTNEWLDQWTLGDASPVLVRLEVSFPPGDLRSWPSLLMPLEQALP